MLRITHMADHTEKFRQTVRGYGVVNATRVRSAEGSAVGKTSSGASAAKRLAVKSAQRTGLSSRAR
jgi:hypothetical protein